MKAAPARGPPFALGVATRRRTGWRRFVLSIFFLLLVAVGYMGLFAIKARAANDFQGTVGKPRLAWAGAYHVHSNRSDGRGSVEEIATAAAGAELTFVVFTDHNQPPQPPRFDHGVLLIFGTELSTRWGHLVALGTSRALTREELVNNPVQHVLDLGGSAYLAHPIQNKMPWSDWEAARMATGLELYSADTMLRQALRSPVTRLLPAVGSYFSNPTYGLLSLVESQPELDERLRQLSASSAKVALCGVDAHGVPPYLQEFRLLQMNVPHGPGEELPTDPEAAAGRIVGAIAAGRTYCVFRALGDASGFEIEGLGTDQRAASVGARLRIAIPGSVSAETQLRVTGPGRLLSDGRTVLLEQPGAVQIEVWQHVPWMTTGPDNKPWIIPSPVRVLQ